VGAEDDQAVAAGEGRRRPRHEYAGGERGERERRPPGRASAA
jgi:hypothetical protein